MTRNAFAASLALGASAALALSACARHSTPAEKAAAEATDNVKGLIAAYSAHDVDRSVAYDAPDYVGIFHGNADVVGPDADRAEMQAQFKEPSTKFDLGKGRVTVSKAGDLAVYEAPYTYSMTDSVSGAPVTEKGTWIGIWKRQPDGSLKLWRSIGANGPAEPAAGG